MYTTQDAVKGLTIFDNKKKKCKSILLSVEFELTYIRQSVDSSHTAKLEKRYITHQNEVFLKLFPVENILKGAVLHFKVSIVKTKPKHKQVKLIPTSSNAQKSG